jgi:hypothetical protein
MQLLRRRFRLGRRGRCRLIRRLVGGFVAPARIGGKAEKSDRSNGGNKKRFVHDSHSSFVGLSETNERASGFTTKATFLAPSLSV